MKPVCCFQSDMLKVWDLRNPTTHLAQLCRPLHTNQRLYFDLYRDRYLLSGCGNGSVLVWDIGALSQSDLSPLITHIVHGDPVTGCRLALSLSVRLYCTVLCSVHPHLPLLGTTSGQRHFPLPADTSDDEEDLRCDNSLKIWSLSLS